MANIKVFALGGLGENGKNMYIVEVEKSIFILDAGIKYPDIDMYGVDAVIPDMSYLVENKDRVEGIFISHAFAISGLTIKTLATSSPFSVLTSTSCPCSTCADSAISRG